MGDDATIIDDMYKIKSNVILEGNNITVSNNLSSHFGTISASKTDATHIIGGKLQLENIYFNSDNTYERTTGVGGTLHNHCTNSGNISSSGTIYSNGITGTLDEYLLLQITTFFFLVIYNGNRGIVSVGNGKGNNL